MNIFGRIVKNFIRKKLKVTDFGDTNRIPNVCFKTKCYFLGLSMLSIKKNIFLSGEKYVKTRTCNN